MVCGGEIDDPFGWCPRCHRVTPRVYSIDPAGPGHGTGRDTRPGMVTDRAHRIPHRRDVHAFGRRLRGTGGLLVLVALLIPVPGARLDLGRAVVGAVAAAIVAASLWRADRPGAPR